MWKSIKLFLITIILSITLFLWYMYASFFIIWPWTHQEIADMFVTWLCSEDSFEANRLRSKEFKNAVSYEGENSFVDQFYKSPYCLPAPKTIEWESTWILSDDNTVYKIATLIQQDWTQHKLWLILDNTNLKPRRRRISHAIPWIEDLYTVWTQWHSEYCKRIENKKISTEKSKLTNCEWL